MFRLFHSKDHELNKEIKPIKKTIKVMEKNFNPSNEVLLIKSYHRLASIYDKYAKTNESIAIYLTILARENSDQWKFRLELAVLYCRNRNYQSARDTITAIPDMLTQPRLNRIEHFFVYALILENLRAYSAANEIMKILTETYDARRLVQQYYDKYKELNAFLVHQMVTSHLHPKIIKKNKESKKNAARTNQDTRYTKINSSKPKASKRRKKTESSNSSESSSSITPTIQKPKASTTKTPNPAPSNAGNPIHAFSQPLGQIGLIRPSIPKAQPAKNSASTQPAKPAPKTSFWSRKKASADTMEYHYPPDIPYYEKRGYLQEWEYHHDVRESFKSGNYNGN